MCFYLLFLRRAGACGFPCGGGRRARFPRPSGARRARAARAPPRLRHPQGIPWRCHQRGSAFRHLRAGKAVGTSPIGAVPLFCGGSCRPHPPLSLASLAYIFSNLLRSFQANQPTTKTTPISKKNLKFSLISCIFNFFFFTLPPVRIPGNAEERPANVAKWVKQSLI